MVDADYFDGRSSRRHAARLSVAGDTLQVEGAFGRRSEPLAAVEVSEPMGGAPRTLRFADGAFCEVRDHARLAALLATAGVGESLLVRAQARWHWALVALAGMVAVVAATYLWGLPWLGRTLAPGIPDAFTRTISEAALSGLDRQLLVPSKLPEARRQAIAARVAALAGGATLPAHRLLYRSAPRVGPNAFALPNGDVVILDELVALAGSDDEIAAVVAHELGHVSHRHGLRQLIQSTVVTFVVGVYFGDISTAAAGLGALVLESRYSREFEREADTFAVGVLRAAGASTEPLARMLERIEAAQARRHGASGGNELFSSHPETKERIAALRSAAMR